MSIAPTLFVAGNTFTAADLLSRVTTVEDFINGGTATGDLEDAAPWAKSQHFVRPEFYGSPHPRVQLVTGPTAYRRRSGDWYQAFMLSDDVAVGKWIPIHGLCEPLVIAGPPGSTTANVTVRASFYAYERDADPLGAGNNLEGAKLRMFLDGGTPYESTERQILGSGSTNDVFYRHHHTMEKLLIGVSRGNHSVGIAIKLNAAGDPLDWNRFWVKNGTFAVRPQYR